MSCDKLPRVQIEDSQGHLDYWWKRHNAVVELLHSREDQLRYSCHFIHESETGHSITRTKKVWKCEDCQIDFKVIELDDILLIAQSPYHYPGDEDGCGSGE